MTTHPRSSVNLLALAPPSSFPRPIRRPSSHLSPRNSSRRRDSHSHPRTYLSPPLLHSPKPYFHPHLNSRGLPLLRTRLLQRLRSHLSHQLTKIHISNLAAQSLSLSTRREFAVPHKASVLCMAADKSDGGRYLLSCDLGGSICLFDTDSDSGVGVGNAGVRGVGQMERVEALACLGSGVTKHKFGVSSVDWYSLDSGMFFSGGYDKRVRVWDTNQMEIVRTFRLSGKVMDCRCDVAGGTVAVACDRDYVFSLCDLRVRGGAVGSLRRMGTRAHRGSVLCVQWSPFSPWEIVSAAADGSVLLWDLRRSGWLRCFASDGSGELTGSCSLKASERNSVVPKAHNGPCNGALFLKDENRLLTTGLDNGLRLWEVGNGKLLQDGYAEIRNSHENRTLRMCLTRSGRYVIHPNGSDLDLYEIGSGTYVRTLHSPHYSRVNCVVCRHGVGHEEIYSGGDDHTMFIYDSGLSKRKFSSA